MRKIRISAVKYANTYPFIYGLRKSGFDRRVILETDHPADCAAKLVNGNADIGLIPVAAIPLLKEYHIISDYCIGAFGKVRTVMLLSNTSFEKVNRINLDYRSLSSVNLTKVLAKNMWKREFKWIDTREGFDFINIGQGEAVVLIGDQCFEFENRFRYKTDLAWEWKKYTGLPFVFACWVANCEIEQSFVDDFNKALKSGLDNLDDVARVFGNQGTIPEKELIIYLKNSIDYILDDRKKEAMKLFLGLMSKL